jgi:hypothetical protein
MKLEFLPQEGGSITRHGSTTTPEPGREGESRAEVLKGNGEVDVAEIEARARALRAAAIADLASRFRKWLSRVAHRVSGHTRGRLSSESGRKGH